VAIKQQDHPTWKGKSAPTNWQGPGNALNKTKDSSNAAFFTIKQSLLSNFYSCLSPPPRQVKEHKPNNPPVLPSSKKQQVNFSNTCNISSIIPAITRYKMAARWRMKIQQWCDNRKYIIGINNAELQQGICNGTIATTIANSGATSGVGIMANPCHCLGQPSNKQFILPSGDVIPATEMAKYPFNIRAPANELHITPGVSQHSLLITGKFAAANYITVFDKKMVNNLRCQQHYLHHQQRSHSTWFLWPSPQSLPNSAGWHGAEQQHQHHHCQLPSNQVPTRSTTTQQGSLQCLQIEDTTWAGAIPSCIQGFPTKPTWLAAIKNKQFASWPGLTLNATWRHFPDSEETHKGHGRKTPSGLRSTKTKQGPLLDNSNYAFGANQDAQLPLQPVKKEKTIFYRTLDLKDEATQKKLSDQPGRFPKKSSKGNQYIMVLTESNSDIILIEAMKNHSSGKMIRAYQKLNNCLIIVVGWY
jgi:hypothetical protein